MDYKKIKKSESSLGGIIFSLFIAIFVFSAGFYWISSNATESGRQVDAMYNTSFTQLQVQQDNLSSSITELRDSAQALTEPGEGFSVAWNGLKGLVNVFRVPFQLISIGDQAMDVTLTPVATLVPEWVITLIKIALVAFIILVIIAIFKGDSGKVIN